MIKKKLIASALASYILGSVPMTLSAEEVGVFNQIITQEELSGVSFEGVMSRVRLEKILEWNAERVYQLDPQKVAILEGIIQKHKDLEAIYGQDAAASMSVQVEASSWPNRPRCMAAVPSDIDSILTEIDETAMSRPNRPRCMAAVPSDIDSILAEVDEVAMPRPNRPRCMAAVPSDIDTILTELDEVAMPRPNRPRCMAAIPTDLESIISEIQILEKDFKVNK